MRDAPIFYNMVKPLAIQESCIYMWLMAWLVDVQ